MTLQYDNPDKDVILQCQSAFLNQPERSSQRKKRMALLQLLMTIILEGMNIFLLKKKVDSFYHAMKKILLAVLPAVYQVRYLTLERNCGSVQINILYKKLIWNFFPASQQHKHTQ